MTSNPLERPTRYKFSSDELMELIDLFGVSAENQTRIRAILDTETTPPNGHLFRYYNNRSKVAVLEAAFAEKLKVPYALGLNSCTSALISALAAAGIGPGMEVIVPAYTFFATVSAVVVSKAIPVITEIDESLGLNPDAVRKNITPRTKAIIAVHMNGYPARIAELAAIAQEHNLVLIEDTAQSAGGTYQGKYVGTWGDMGCYSLDAYKIIACGEGGMLTTSDEWLYTRAQSYHDTAACWRPDRYGKERQPGELFCGENYRMSELSAAVSLAQLPKLDWINQSCRTIWAQLQQEIQLPTGAQWIRGADPEGVCGYRLGILFDSYELAHKVITADIGIGGIAGGGSEGFRDWHVYWHWDHILEQKTVTPDGCPFKCPLAGPIPPYSKDMCPQSKNILLRMGQLAINPTDTPEWASAYAEQMTRHLRNLIQ